MLNGEDWRCAFNLSKIGLINSPKNSTGAIIFLEKQKRFFSDDRLGIKRQLGVKFLPQEFLTIVIFHTEKTAFQNSNKST